MANAVTVAAACPVDVPNSLASRGSMGSQMRKALALTKAASASSAMARLRDWIGGIAGPSIGQAIAGRHAARRDHLSARAQFAQRQARRLGFLDAIAILVDGIRGIDQLAVGARGLQGQHAVVQQPAAG